MSKPFSNCYWTANRALTNLIADCNYEIENWEEEARNIERSLIQYRIEEEDEMFLPLQGVAVDIWTGMARLMTRDELRAYKAKSLNDRLEELNEQSEKIRKQLEEMNKPLRNKKKTTRIKKRQMPKEGNEGENNEDKGGKTE